jgi:S-phase kinase-associated protein 1
METDSTATPQVEAMGLDDGDDEKYVLQCAGDTEFDIDRKFAMISNLIKTMAEGDESTTTFPVPNVKEGTMKHIIKFMNHHEGKDCQKPEQPLKNKDLSKLEEVTEWDANFIAEISENRQELYDLILAANYMDIQGLLHLGCAKVASLIKGEPLEKIKDILAP